MTNHHFGCRLCLQAADVARMIVVGFIRPLFAGKSDLISIDDNNEITGINMRGVRRLVLPGQDPSNLRGKPTEDLVLSIKQDPRLFVLIYILLKIR